MLEAREGSGMFWRLWPRYKDHVFVISVTDKNVCRGRHCLERSRKGILHKGNYPVEEPWPALGTVNQAGSPTQLMGARRAPCRDMLHPTQLCRQDKPQNQGRACLYLEETSESRSGPSDLREWSEPPRRPWCPPGRLFQD